MSSLGIEFTTKRREAISQTVERVMSSESKRREVITRTLKRIISSLSKRREVKP